VRPDPWFCVDHGVSRRFLLSLVAGAAVLVVAVGCLLRALPLVALVPAAIAIFALPGLVTRDRAAAIAIAASALVLGPLFALPTFYAMHPPMRIDNAGESPVDIWIDGARRMTVASNLHGREPPWLRVAVGKHRLAWSAVGAPMGLHEIEVDVGPFGDHLYSPGGSGCYWLSVTAYGGASTHGIEHGPLPLSEFHRLSGVDVWFADNPARISAPLIRRGSVRVAVQRWHACMELAAIGCDPSQRRGYVDCMRTIDGHSGSADCLREAARTCPALAPAQVEKP
jgi:hypothetical protein